MGEGDAPSEKPAGGQVSSEISPEHAAQMLPENDTRFSRHPTTKEIHIFPPASVHPTQPRFIRGGDGKVRYAFVKPEREVPPEIAKRVNTLVEAASEGGKISDLPENVLGPIEPDPHDEPLPDPAEEERKRRYEAYRAMKERHLRPNINNDNNNKK